uniref:VP1 n=1 Tax=Motacilla cinerea densovirus TaxID=2794499 RepID=A0A8A4XE66_9VIRU|nr:MAG: VP1 [Motacilla cinerea densovirus]
MFKRKSDSTNSESPAKKGGPGTAAEEKTDPIPRHLPSSSITLNFTRRSFEEIAPGILYYLPLCQSVKYMFDEAMLGQYMKFRDLWETMEIHSPKARLTNLIMLQDDLRVQNNTPTDATAFTQVVYLMKYCPVGQKQYFKLSNVPNTSDIKSQKTLTYKIDPRGKDPTSMSQLTQIDGYETFDKLSILGARAHRTAGFVPAKNVSYDIQDYSLNDPYIAPNTPMVHFSTVSGNLQTPDTTDNFVGPAEVLTMAINQDNISMYKYGDIIDIPIVTNLEGLKLANTSNNDFTQDVQIETHTQDPSTNAVYATEWAYPSRNRPFLNRGNYYDPNTDPILMGKKFKHLNHCFLTMPPIRKPNGALLGQRCSCILEQSFSVTFHMSQATFIDVDEEEEANPNTLQVNQDNQIELRRNIYGKPFLKQIKEPSVFCPGPNSVVCPTFAPGKAPQLSCYEDTWQGLTAFMVELGNLWNVNTFIQYAKVDPARWPEDTDAIISSEEKYINMGASHPPTSAELKFRKAWRIGLKRIADGDEGMIRIGFESTGGLETKDKYQYMVAKKFPNDLSTDVWTQKKPKVEVDNYIYFNIKKFLDNYYKNSEVKCAITAPEKADPVFDKTCNLFFT